LIGNLSETQTLATAQPRRSVLATWSMAIPAATTAGMLLYLGGGALAGARLVTFVVGLLLPAAALLSETGLLRNLSASIRTVTSLSLAILLITPAFYIRRALPFPGWMVDLIFVIALCSAAIYRGAYIRLLHDIRTPLFRAASLFLFVVLPALFVLTWMGFGVHEAGQVFYYGLFPIDFGNLTNIVAVINASPGLPHWPVAGTGILHYHWLFFVFPAWLSSLGGGHTSDAIALVLCNYIAACILFLAISAAADHVLLAIDRPMAASAVVMAAGVVALGSLVMYPYQMLVGIAVRLTHIQFLAIAVRNGLLLSIPNSLTVFGNNTMALAMALLVLVLLLEWNRRGEKGHLVLGAIFLAMIIGYSITLIFPMALTLGVWLLLARIRRPLLAAIVFGVIGAALAGTMAFGLHMFGSGKPLAVAFDNGAYLRHVLFAFSPLWALALLSRQIWGRLSLFCTLIVACVLVPSFLYISNTLTGQIDFSMKIAALIAVAACPLACVGLARSMKNWRSPAAALTLALIVLGLLCTAAYAGQFAFLRLRHNHDRTMALPADYVAALEFIRDNTPSQAIVIDPQSMPYALTIPTVFVGERRVYLPTEYGEQVLGGFTVSPEVARRKRDFEQWSKDGFVDGNLSAQFASQADYCLLAGLGPRGRDWTLIRTFGGYSVWESKAHSPHPET
jgi:hypothetical protein